MVLYPPTMAFQRLLLLCAQVQVIGGPMPRVPVWGDRPEHLDHSVAPQVDCPAAGRYLHRVHADAALPVRVHPPVAAELSQPDPAAFPLLLQVLRAAVPAAEEDPAGPEAPAISRK